MEPCKEQDIKYPIYTGPLYLCCFCKTFFISLPFLQKHLEKCKDMQIMMILKSQLNLDNKNKVKKRNFTSENTRNNNNNHLVKRTKNNQEEITTIHNPHFNITYDNGEHTLKLALDLNKGQKEKLSCLLCNLSFDDFTYYQQHMEIHKKVEKKQFHINIIDTKQISTNLSTPINQKDKDLKFKCTYCYRTFDRKIALINHLKVHSKQRPIICDECRINFKSLTSFKTHLVDVHNNLRKNTCTQCDKVFRTKDMYKQHRIMEHASKYECDLCSKYFYFQHRLDNHKIQKHNIQTSHASNQGQHLERHKNINPGNNSNSFKKNLIKIKVKDVSSINNSIINECLLENQDGDINECHPCELCFSIFNNSNDYEDHMKKHKVEIVQPKKSSYICTECGKICPKKEDLDFHYKIAHQQLKPFKCDICLRGFATAGNLMKHASKHPETKLFKCAECKEIFVTKESHKRHVMVVHNKGGPLQCNECGKYYSNKLILEYHLTTVHLGNDNFNQ